MQTIQYEEGDKHYGFEEFRENLMEDLRDEIYQRTGNDCEVEATNVSKLQNAGYEGIVIRPEDSQVGINLDAEQEVSFTYAGPERSAEEIISGREGARLGETEGRASVLKILADKEPEPKDTHRPIKLSWGSKDKGAER